jgi:hypothetical protein
MAYYGVTSSEGPMNPEDYIGWFSSEAAAQAAAVDYAKQDQGTYYVHCVNPKPTFKASVVKTVTTEVMS